MDVEVGSTWRRKSDGRVVIVAALVGKAATFRGAAIGACPLAQWDEKFEPVGVPGE